MTQEGTYYILFVLSKAAIPDAGAGGIGSLAVDRNNRTDGAESNNAPNLLSGCTSNLHYEDMADILHKWIDIAGDNNPVPKNVPR